MEKAFLVGLALGMMGGAVLIANSYKLRRMVINSQQDIMDKVDKLSQEREKKNGKNAEKN